MINSGQSGQRPPVGGMPAGGVQRPGVGGAAAPRAPVPGTAARPMQPGTAARPMAPGTAQRPVAPGAAQRPAAPGTMPAGARPPAGAMPQRAMAPGGAAPRPAAPVGAMGGAAGGKLTVGIADMKLLQGDGEIITYALGSCIGICLWDPPLKLGALIHIMLPINMEPGRKNTMKYADTGIKETLNQLAAKGARKERLVAKIAGGAKMFEVAGNSNLGNIGARNIESVKMNLRKEGIKLVAENVGGSVARTLSFYPATGVGEIRAYGQPVITL